MCKLDQIATKLFNEIKDLHPIEGLEVVDRIASKIIAARDQRRAELELELNSLDIMPKRTSDPTPSEQRDAEIKALLKRSGRSIGSTERDSTGPRYHPSGN